ncbi:MAG: hypothetical protein ABI165_09240 [Bryobacteraceae bacterium]
MNVFDQAFADEPVQSLSHRCVADPDLLGEFPVAKSHSWPEFAFNKLAAEMFIRIPDTFFAHNKFCGGLLSGLKAQRVRRAPPIGTGTISRRTPFCASSLKVKLQC